MALSDSSIRQAAELIVRGRLGQRSPIGHLPKDCRPTNVVESLSIQEAVHELLQENGHGEVVGTKIGCTTKVMQDYLGMTHPCSGAIFDSTVQYQLGEFEFNSFLHVGVECEIAVKLSSPLKASKGPFTIQTVSEAVGEFYPAIEIVDDRYVDFVTREPDWQTWVADDFFGAGVVLGDPINQWRELDLAEVYGWMTINGFEVGSGYGRDIINGHPLEALLWLANTESKRGRDLPADWIIMLGSMVQTKWVDKGDLVEIQIEGLGKASARFV